MFTIVRQQRVKVLETLGKFTKVLKPGLNIYVPFFQTISKEIKMNILQDNIEYEVKTKDNVFVKFGLAIQYKIGDDESQIIDAYYKLDRPLSQMNSYIENIVRSTSPKLTLDELFESKDDICNAVKKELSPLMSNYGYQIINTLVTNIEPNQEVKTAMNKINASSRLAIVAENEAKANKIKIIKDAEAKMEEKRLQGEGIAQQRSAIINGLKESIDDLVDKIHITPLQAINMSLMALHYDTLKEIGTSNNNKTIFIPKHDNVSNTSKDLMNQILYSNN